MGKLELKHLAGYLPYGLEAKYQLTDIVNSERSETRSKLMTAENVDFVLKYCMPILRPLSDLTKEIEHNGEKFVPIEKFGTKYSSYESSIYKHTLNECCSDLESFNLLDRIRIIDKLLEWHFDIHGLLENNLAIDKNTLL